jgi:16S rRNA (uracil1498-N3)-methyltransferase
MSERFFVPGPIRADLVLLTGSEAHHLLHVMRARVGDRVVLFDGTGWEFEAEVVQIARQEARLRICRQSYVDRELPVLLVVGVAMPKGDRQRWLVEKAVELGVGRLVPLIGQRSVVRPGPALLARLRRSVIEASKQCGRNRLMEIGGPMGWSEWVSAYQGAGVRWVADPAGRPVWAEAMVCREAAGRGEGAGRLEDPARGAEPCCPGGESMSGRGVLSAVQPGGLVSLAEGAGPPATRAETSEASGEGPAKPIWAVAVGPEGGWTPEELQQAQAAGWQPVSLGPRILRTETAVLALAALLAAQATGSCAAGSARREQWV